MANPLERQAAKCTACGWATRYLAEKTCKTRICPFCNEKRLVPWTYA